MWYIFLRNKILWLKENSYNSQKFCTLKITRCTVFGWKCAFTLWNRIDFRGNSNQHIPFSTFAFFNPVLSFFPKKLLTLFQLPFFAMNPSDIIFTNIILLHSNISIISYSIWNGSLCCHNLSHPAFSRRSVMWLGMFSLLINITC